MSSLSIDGTTLASLGFYLSGVQGHIATGGPKPQGDAAEEYSSENYFGEVYRQESNEITVSFFGDFVGVNVAEQALYSIYAILAQPGSHTVVHSNGVESITVTAVWAGATVKAKRKLLTRMVLDVELKLTKTDA